MRTVKVEPSTQVKQAADRSSRRLLNNPVFLLILSFVLFLFQITALYSNNVKASQVERLPVSIRAGSEADYSQDSHAYGIPPINERIINQIITEFPATGSPQERMGTLQAVFSTPVPSMTPDRNRSTSFTPTLPAPLPTRLAISPTPSGFATPLPTPTNYLPFTPTVIYASSTPTLPLFTSTSTNQPLTLTATIQPPTATIKPPAPTNANPTQKPKPTKKPNPTQKPKPTKKP
jgi:hypothetical protein